MSENEQVAPRFVGGRERTKRIPLEWPVEYGGKVFDAIAIRRLTAREVADWQESLKGLPEDAEARFPLFVAPDGGALPDGLLDVLDDDDRLVVDKAALDFLPRRFRTIQNGGSEPSTGADTGRSSVA